jgi:hypothetical protein
MSWRVFDVSSYRLIKRLKRRDGFCYYFFLLEDGFFLGGALTVSLIVVFGWLLAYFSVVNSPVSERRYIFLVVFVAIV